MDSFSANMMQQSLSHSTATRLESAGNRLGRTATVAHKDASERETKIRAAAKDFEAMFISQMLEHMFSDIKMDPMSDGGLSDGVYKSMMITEYGKIMSEAGGIGVADHVTRQLLQEQEVGQSHGLKMMGK